MTHTLSGISVSRETMDKLKLYQRLLEDWQKKINLVSPSSLNQAWDRHFIDSLQLLLYLPQKQHSLIDLGAGAGFPGLILAIAEPQKLSVTLVEANLKKCLFLENVSRETMTPVTILRERIEDLDKTLNFDVVTARGLAPLSHLFAYTHHLIKKESMVFFLKGKEFLHEIEEAKKKWDFELEIYPSMTDSKARLLKITSLRIKRMSLDD